MKFWSFRFSALRAKQFHTLLSTAFFFFFISIFSCGHLVLVSYLPLLSPLFFWIYRDKSFQTPLSPPFHNFFTVGVLSSAGHDFPGPSFSSSLIFFYTGRSNLKLFAGWVDLYLPAVAFLRSSVSALVGSSVVQPSTTNLAPRIHPSLF